MTCQHGCTAPYVDDLGATVGCMECLNIGPSISAIQTLRENQAKLIKRFSDAEAERDALQRFKEFVHHRLDTAGIPTHPDGPHIKEGCRIGDRLDLIVQDRDAMRALAGELADLLEWQLRDRAPHHHSDARETIDKAHAMGIVGGS